MTPGATSRWFEDWTIGERLATHGRTVTEADVVNFAGLTGDINPLHLDAVYAASTAIEPVVGHPLPSRYVRARAATSTAAG